MGWWVDSCKLGKGPTNKKDRKREAHTRMDNPWRTEEGAADESTAKSKDGGGVGVKQPHHAAPGFGGRM